MQMCMVDIDGRLIDIPQEAREPKEGEYKVPLEGYYECLNEKRYPDAVYKHNLKKWVGVGEQRPEPSFVPNEIDLIKEKLIKAQDSVITALDVTASIYEASLDTEAKVLTALDVSASLYEELLTIKMQLEGGN